MSCAPGMLRIRKRFIAGSSASRREIQPLLLKNGGPIIAVQVENEYGSFGDDAQYLENVRKELIKTGMGDTLLYTANPWRDLRKGSPA